MKTACDQPLGKGCLVSRTDAELDERITDHDRRLIEVLVDHCEPEM